MLDPERRDMATNDLLVVLGEQNYDAYAHFAAESNVPLELFDISKSLTLDKLNTVSIRALASLIFNQDFSDEEEAWRMLRYAEAISAIKKFELIQNDEDLTEDEFGEKLGEVEVIVGSSALSLDGHLGEVKNRVEIYFADPLNRMRLLSIGMMSSGSAAA